MEAGPPVLPVVTMGFLSIEVIVVSLQTMYITSHRDSVPPLLTKNSRYRDILDSLILLSGILEVTVACDSHSS